MNAKVEENQEEDKEKKEVYVPSPCAQAMARFTDEAGDILVPTLLDSPTFLARLYFYCPEKD